MTRTACRTIRSAAAAAAACAMVVTACAHDGRTMRQPVYPLPDPPVTTVSGTDVPNPTPTTLPTTEVRRVIDLTAQVGTSVPLGSGTGDGAGIRIDRLSSPANATAEMVGRGAFPTDPVTVDDRPGDVLVFDVGEDGTFSMQVRIDDEGAHTVCVAGACGRVYTLAPDAETAEQVTAMIEQAMPLAEAYLDYPTLFPEWTVRIGGALSGTGGTTEPESRTVTIYRNRGRTIDDFVRSILHEFGHVADFERLDDAGRAAYLAARGIDAATPWRDEAAHRLDDWARQPSEDFAEVMVMLWTDGRWTPRTELLAPTPGPSVLERVAALTGSG